MMLAGAEPGGATVATFRRSRHRRDRRRGAGGTRRVGATDDGLKIKGRHLRRPSV
jgi:hypothetical protein